MYVPSSIHIYTSRDGGGDDDDARGCTSSLDIVGNGSSSSWPVGYVNDASSDSLTHSLDPLYLVPSRSRIYDSVLQEAGRAHTCDIRVRLCMYKRGTDLLLL